MSKKDLSCTGKATPGYCLRPYLYIDKNTFNKSKDARLHTFRHELGHVLGLQHEFDRIDRDKYVVISENSNWSDFSVPGIGRIFIGSIGSYDFNSVMNYSNFYHIKNSDGTKGSMISLNDILDISEGDKSTIRHLYGAGGYIY
ncbi:MAG: hypothetical protein K6A43_06070 [Treponema sp.]|nr:hypothetical protein [Treponema sp.]